MLAGTDASGWGTGQVLWMDGSREEHVLRFTAAEKRRPINWRELLGILRVAEVAGERLRGRTLLVETDNMAAKGASVKMASKAADMQELIRRLFRLSEVHGFTLRVTHTPGEKLDRPDQTSRGDASEEPRARVSELWWQRICRRWGPFDSLLGAEREHGQPQVTRSDAITRLWIHPTVSTVGTALRRATERLSEVAGQGIVAVAVVPDDDGPQWNSLIRHGITVGRFREGEELVEMNVLGRWVPKPARRPTRVVLFPRAAGAVPSRLALTHREGEEMVEFGAGGPQQRRVLRGEGYEEMGLGRGLILPVLPGSFLYSVGSGVTTNGCLYRVVAPSLTETYEDANSVVAQELLWDQTKGARKAKVPIFVGRPSDPRWRPDPFQLWVVDHLVEPLSGVEVAGGPSGRRQEKYFFDFREANRQITARSALGETTPSGWLAESPKGAAGVPMGLPVETTAGGYASGYEPFVGPQPEGLEEVVSELDRLRLAQSSVKTGPEGRVEPTVARARGLADTSPAGLVGSRVQPCQYLGIQCGGCGLAFGLGEPMESRGTRVCHQIDSCRRALDTRLASEVQQELATATIGRGPAYHAFFTTGAEASGVFGSGAEVAAAMERAKAHGEEALSQAFASYAEAMECLARWTREEADRSGQRLTAEMGTSSAGPALAKGPIVRRTHAMEKLAPARLAKIRCCIAGLCGLEKADGSATLCRICGVASLHVATCAEMGSGYAALGNFICVNCRLRDEITRDGARLSDTELQRAVSEELRSVTERTMVLELTQGREATAASYADYTQLEERYVMGLGRLLEGAELRLPRHSPMAMRNMLTWLSLDADRSKSLESFVRMASAFFTKVEIPNVIDGSVRAHLKELLEQCGVEHEPATEATPRMLGIMVTTSIPKRFNLSPFLVARERIQVVCEGVGGCRIGEVAGGGEGHGLLANETCLVEDPAAEAGDIAASGVEAKLEHSKTGFSRYLNMAGTTKGVGIEVAQYFAEYWRLAGFRLSTSMQNGLRVTRPDFWVLQVSLLGLSETQLEAMLSWAGASGIGPIAYGMRTLGVGAAARRRYSARGTASQAKKYINLMGSHRTCVDLARGQMILTEKGFTATIVPGPLLLSTTGGANARVSAMPLSTSTTFAVTKELLTDAHRRANADPDDPDPDLNLREGEEPRWTTHSLRRLADTVARRDREATGTSEDEIDIFFGWQERILRKAMQVHYAGLNIRARLGLVRITGWL